MNRENRPPRGWSRYKAARAGIPIRNARNTMDGLLMLKSLDDRCASLVWFDPQYRGVLDHLAFGNEGAGLSEALRSCARPFSIPMSEKVESLNVAAAAAICLFERVRQLAWAATA